MFNARLVVIAPVIAPVFTFVATYSTAASL